MAPAADMFEMGVKLQVLKRGTMFPMRAQKLYELYRAHGCPACDHTGYRGRTTILELLEMTEPMRRAVIAHADADTLRDVAREGGGQGIGKGQALDADQLVVQVHLEVDL